MQAWVIRRKSIVGQRFHLACLDDGRLIGVAAMRDDSHLFQFFAGTRWHGCGIARQPWQRTLHDAQQCAGSCHFTLSSSAMAVPVYRHLGFVPGGPLKEGEPAWSSSPCDWFLRQRRRWHTVGRGRSLIMVDEAFGCPLVVSPTR